LVVSIVQVTDSKDLSRK